MRSIVFIVQVLFVAATLLHAQDTLSDNDVFDSGAFDRAVAQGAAADSQNRLEYLPGISFVAEAAGYRTPAYDASGSDARFYGKAFLKASKADIGALYLAYNYSYFLYASAGDSHYSTFYLLQSPDPLDLKASLSEFHCSFDITKLVFIRIGSQLLSWGATWFWTPEDFINRQRAQASVISVVDIRNGKPGVRLHVPYKSMNLFLFTDFSNVVSKGAVGSFGEKVAQAWRIDGTFRGVNIGTVGYIAKNRPEQIGFDATGNVLGADLYGELAFTFTDAGRSAPHCALSAGGSRTFGRERNWTGRTEFYYNDKGYGDTDLSRLPAGEFTPFYSGKYYAYAEITGTSLLNSMFAVSLFGFGNLADRSFSTTLQFTLDFPGVPPFTIYGRYYGGRRNREFTRAFGGSAFGGGVRIRVDF
ncbi:MAG: hypothetical protein JW913_13480 [Chitinispirillaceae bacterium]|nr:hypothetical protein [Chitinispirillaceae bacterium]